MPETSTMKKTAKGRNAPQKGHLKLRRRTKRLLWAGAGLVAAGLTGFFFYQWTSRLPGMYLPSLGNAHIQVVAGFSQPYNSDPPTSGPHLPSRAPWGIHTAPVQKELQVHNLEDGGVLVQYSCPQGCPDLLEKLKAIVTRYDTRVILAPYPQTDRRIVLTAWTRIDKFDEFDEKRIVRFIDAYRGIDHHAPKGF